MRGLALIPLKPTGSPMSMPALKSASAASLPSRSALLPSPATVAPTALSLPLRTETDSATLWSASDGSPSRSSETSL